jgi:hypothetical protein
MEKETDLKPGYRWLNPGEIIEHGDLWWWDNDADGVWEPAKASIGNKAGPGMQLQRKIGPRFTCKLCSTPYQSLKPGHRLIRTNHGNPIGEWECSPACKGFVVTESPPDNTAERIENLEKALTRLVAAQNQLAQEKAAYQGKLAVAQEQIAELEATRSALQEDLRLAAGERDSFKALRDDIGKSLEAAQGRERKLEKDLVVLQQVVAKGAASGWVKYEDRKPTVEDSDADGDVLTCTVRGSTSYLKFRDIPSDNKPWWRPANLPVELSPFMKWYRGVPDSVRGLFQNLDGAEAAWKSIVNPSGETE